MGEEEQERKYMYGRWREGWGRRSKRENICRWREGKGKR
jgi:hypothetical protein